jgi:sporulation protein YlmC with PRC-barrel domain
MDAGLDMVLVSSDDKEVGTVDQLILDQATITVNALVVRRGTLIANAVEVPMGALAIGNDGNVRLSYTAEQFEALPPFDPNKYMSPLVPTPAGTLGVPATGSAPVTRKSPEGAGPEALESQGLGYVLVRAGSSVHSRDGKEVGAVHQLSYDPNTGRLRRFAVREGMFLAKEVELPVELIGRVDNDALQLVVDADQVHEAEIR